MVSAQVKNLALKCSFRNSVYTLFGAGGDPSKKVELNYV